MGGLEDEGGGMGGGVREIGGGKRGGSFAFALHVRRRIHVLHGGARDWKKEGGVVCFCFE